MVENVRTFAASKEKNEALRYETANAYETLRYETAKAYETLRYLTSK